VWRADKRAKRVESDVQWGWRFCESYGDNDEDGDGDGEEEEREGRKMIRLLTRRAPKETSHESPAVSRPRC
jgi:hypothetical protein